MLMGMERNARKKNSDPDIKVEVVFVDSDSEQMAEGDMDDIRAHMKGLARIYGYEIKVPESLINNIGYGQLRSGNTEKAVRLFKYNIELYPDSANVYDSLGEALEAEGKLKSARATYRKAFERGRKNRDPGTAVYK